MNRARDVLGEYSYTASAKGDGLTTEAELSEGTTGGSPSAAIFAAVVWISRSPCWNGNSVPPC